MADEVYSNPQGANPGAPSQAPQPAPGRGRRIAVLVTLLVAAVALVVVLLVPAKSPAPSDDWYDGGATLTSYDGWTDEEINNDLNAIIEANEMNCTCLAEIDVNAATGEAHVGVRNIEANHFDQKFTLALADGTVLYESGGVAPGQTLEYVVINTTLEPGTYDATITFQGYNAESHTANGGTAGFAVTLNVA